MMVAPWLAPTFKPATNPFPVAEFPCARGTACRAWCLYNDRTFAVNLAQKTPPQLSRIHGHIDRFDLNTIGLARIAVDGLLLRETRLRTSFTLRLIEVSHESSDLPLFDAPSVGLCGLSRRKCRRS